MKKILLILLICILVYPINVKAYGSSASAAILMDMDTHRVIYVDNPHTRRSVASISKIMTAILAIESGRMEDIVVIGDEIERAYGSGVYIKPGEEIRLRDLVYGLMLRSGNDAALSIAAYIGTSVDDFVTQMNEKAIEIGMKNTLFNNPSGLDERGGNISSVYDMAILTSYAMKNEMFREISMTKSHQVKTNKNTYSWTNKHRLLRSYKYSTGGKTGFTDIAKRTLVSTASKDNINLVAVTLNGGNDFNDHRALFEEAFGEFTKYEILRKGYIEIVDEKFYSNRKFYIEEDFSTILSNNDKQNIILNFKLEKKFSYKTGDKVGVVKVVLNNKEIFETNVYIEIDRKKISLFRWLFGWMLNDE